MPLVGDKGRGSGRHRGGRVASPVRGHLLTQLTHEGHVRAPNRVPKAKWLKPVRSAERGG
eukprot:scaffold31696_cov139-Isochrysis_galbana.AAC.2